MADEPVKRGAEGTIPEGATPEGGSRLIFHGNYPVIDEEDPHDLVFPPQRGDYPPNV